MKTLDYIALIVTSSISFMLLFIVISPVLTGRVLSENKAQLVSSLIAGFMTIVGMYIGAKLKGGDK